MRGEHFSCLHAATPLGDRDDLTGRHGAEAVAFDDAPTFDMLLTSLTRRLGIQRVIDREEA